MKLRLDKVRKQFGAATAVDEVSLEVNGGTFLTLLGASGSGKSTTLMLIAGFLEPDAGSISVDGENVVGTPAHKRNFGVMFQSYALFPHMRVFDNVAFPLKMQRSARTETRNRVDEALALVKLVGLEDRLPHQLSGGQQQRVALARAIVARPRLLLMDEPLSALDKQLREHMQLELKNIHRQLGVTVVYVTHDQSEALVMSDRIAVMRDGRIEQFGTPRDIYDRPATRYVAEFVGDSNFFKGTVQAVRVGACTISCGSLRVEATGSIGLRVGDAVQFAIRPERLRVGFDAALGNHVGGQVEEIVYVGDALKLRVRTADDILFNVKTERASSIENLRPNDKIALSWSAESTVPVEARS
ncbi:MAG: ABC transporter ATP-binding protein [Burkholderiaceae bacterium]